MPSTTAQNATRNATFEELALPLLVSLFNHASWLTRDRAEAEDIVQESLSKALRAFGSFQADTNFKAWIFCILRNTFLTSRTGIAASRTVFLEDSASPWEMAASEPSPEEIVIRLDDLSALEAALDRIPPPLREVLLLCDVEEMKYKDIALILGVPIGTVMSRISRARQALRQLLRPMPGGSI